MAWLSGYSKRKKITLTGGTSGAQTDYQLKLAVSYAAAMQGDFDDLRFTQADGTTLIDAWAEVIVTDTSATAWVEFPTTPANGVEQDYYMYYGNGDVDDTWDIDDTFLFGDSIDKETCYATDGSDRATAYSMSDHIIRYGTKTHICYLKYESAAHKAYVRSYNHSTSSWGSEVLLGTTNDNHGIPTFAIDSSGYIYIFYDGHHTTLKWRKSTNPNDTSAWSSEAALPNQATSPSYISVVIDSSDDVHIIYRETGAAFLSVYYQKYTGSWSSATKLISGADPYHASYDNSIAIDSNDNLHVGVAFFHVSENKGKKVGYAKSTDGGSTWKKSDDTSYTLPITYSAVESIETGDNIRAGNIVVDSSNRPMLVVSRYHNTPHDGKFWRYNGSSWVGTVISVSGKAVSDYIVTGFYDGVIYVFAGVYDSGQSWGHASGEVYIFYSSNSGSSFDQKQISTTDASNANWFPSVERANGANSLSEMRMMWEGGATNPTKIYFAKIDGSYDAELYGFGEFVPYYTWGDKWSEYTSDYKSSPQSIHGVTTGVESGVSVENGVDLSEVTNMPASGIVEMDVKDLGSTNPWFKLISSTSAKYIFNGNNYTGRGFYRGDWATWAGLADMQVLFDGSWHKFVVTYSPTATRIQVDSRTPVDLPTSTAVGYPKTLGLTDTSSSVANDYLLDNVFVRKYASGPPTYAFGSEESAGQPTMRRWDGIPGMQYTGRRSW